MWSNRDMKTKSQSQIIQEILDTIENANRIVVNSQRMEGFDE